MTSEQALSNLITAARSARLTAEEHEAVQDSIKILINIVQNNVKNDNSKDNSDKGKGNSKQIRDN